MVNFVKPLLNLENRSFLKQATTQLKKEGDRISTVLPSGTKVEYIRGENLSGHTRGEKYKLIKEVTKPDNTRYITNANRWGDELYIDQVFYVKPNDYVPDYIPWADLVYQMNPGISKYAEKKDFKFAMAYNVKWLKDLLLKKLPPKGQSGNANYRTYSEQFSGAKSSYRTSANQSSGARTNYREQANSYQSNRTNTNSQAHTNNTTGRKITKDEFIKYMNERLGKYNSISVQSLKDAEIRNLSKLFGIDVDKMKHFDKNTKRELILKFHPDRNKDKHSNEIFTILNKLCA